MLWVQNVKVTGVMHFQWQVEACRQYVKYAVRLESLESAPFHIEKVLVDMYAYVFVLECYFVTITGYVT